MSLKEMVRAGEGGGRVAAVRQELLPAQSPLSRPTRDVCVSNRSHSLAPSDRPSSPPSRPLIDPQDSLDYEKQANIVYTHQFRSLAKLLGNEAMDFEQLRVRIEQLILRDASDPLLLQRIQQLERELSRKGQGEGRSAQSLPASTHEYLRAMETELARKSKLITEVGESAKREAFEEAYQGLQTEVAEKVHSLRQVEEQLQETRVRSAAHIGSLEEELVKRNQTIQKLTFELDNLRRKLQTASEQAQRARQRENELSVSLENDTRVAYNGTPYSLSALLLELNARDQELHAALQLHQKTETQTLALRAEAQNAQNALRKSEALAQSLTARVEYQESVAAKQAQQCSQLREEKLHLQEEKAQLQEERAQLLDQRAEREEGWERVKREMAATSEEKSRLSIAVGQQQAALAQYELSQGELMQDRDNYAAKLAQLQQTLNDQAATHAQLQTDIHRATQERQTLLEEVLQLSQSHQQQEHQLQLLSQEVQLRTQEAIGREQAIEELQRQLEGKQQQRALLEETETALSQMQQELQLQLQQAELHLQQNQQQLAEMERKVQEAEQKLREKEEAARFQAFQLEQVEKQREENHEYLEEEQKLRKHVETQLQQATAKHEEMTATITTLTLQLTQLQSQQELTHSLTQQLTHSEEETSHLRSQTELLHHQLTHAQQQLSQAQEQLSQLTAVEEQLRMREQAERELRAEMEEASSRERRLEEEVQRRKQLQAETEEDFNKERLNYQGQLAHLQDSLHTLHREAEDERHISEEEAAQREQLEQECLAIRLSLTRLEQAEETLQADNRQLHALNQQLQQALAELEAHLASEMQLWLTEKNALEDDLRSAEVQVQSEASRFEELQKEQTATYHHQLEEREKQMHALEEEKNQLEQLISELRNQREELAAQLREAQHSPLQEELPRTDLGFFSFNTHSNPDSPQAHQRIQELERQLENYRLKEDRLAQMSYSYGHDLHDSPNSNQEETLQQIAELHQQVDHLRSQLQQQEMALKEWESEREEWEDELQRRQAHSQQLLQDATQAQLTIFTLTQTNRHYEQQLDSNQKAVSSHQQAVQNYEAEISRLQQQLQQYERQQREEQQSQHEQAQMKNHIAHLEQQLEILQQTNNQNREKIVYLETASLTLKAQLKDINDKNQTLLSENSQLREVVYTASQEAERYRQQLAELPKQEERPAPFSQLSGGSVSSRGREEAPSSDGELTNRILNDPSKISGQDSKFAHLVFENSKIHVVRESKPEIRERQQEDSTLKPQDVLPSTPERKKPAPTVPKEVSAEREESRKEEYKIVVVKQEQRHSLANSLTSIKQAEEQQEMSARQQTSPPSSRQTITPSRQNTPAPTSNNIYSAGSQRLSFEEKPAPYRPTFQKTNIASSNLPIYVGRQSIVVQSQADRRESQSHSGSKSKVRISYGLLNDRSFEIRKRDSERGLQPSEISHAYQRPSTQEHSISHISPVAMRQSEVMSHGPSLVDSLQRKELNSNHTILPHPRSSESFINAISSISHQQPNRISLQREPPADTRRDWLKRETSPRIEFAHSPRHSQVASTPITPASPMNYTTLTPINSNAPSTPTYDTRKEPYFSREPARVVLRSVAGSKRNSQMNETATFGPNSLRRSGMKEESMCSSRDSGIEVLQYDWQAPCCRNE